MFKGRFDTKIADGTCFPVHLVKSLCRIFSFLWQIGPRGATSPSGICCHSPVKQLVSARNIIYFTDKKEEDLHIEFNMYVWKLHILFHNVLAPKNNQVTEQVKGAKIRDKINNDSEWIFLQVSVSAIANPLQTIICRNHKLCDYGPTNMSVVERYQEWKCPQLFFENIVKHRSLHF